MDGSTSMNDLLQKAEEYRSYAQKISNAHYDMAEAAKARHNKLGIPVTVATTIVGTAIFASLSSPTQNLWIQILTGLLSLAAAVLAALQTFFNFSEVSAQHKSAAVAYEAMMHGLDIYILAHAEAPDKEHREAAIQELKEIGESLHEISGRSPTIPDSVYDAAHPRGPRAL